MRVDERSFLGMQRAKRPAQPLLANRGTSLKVDSHGQCLMPYLTNSQRISRTTENRNASKESVV